jgi:hypothetical protein
VRTLSLDISSHTGWSIFENKTLLTHGTIEIPADDNTWPFGIHAWAKKVANKINELVTNNPQGFEKVIIERANSSRFRSSQNFIDWFHFALLEKSIENLWNETIVYMDTAEWRKLCEIKLSKIEKKHNQMISKEKKKGNKVVKVNGKRVGRLTKKHLAVNKVNELFNLKLKLKQNDEAEAILINLAYLTREEKK